MEENIIGIVKWFDYDRGYGYIERTDAREDVIVHTSGIEEGQSLKKGTRVTFDIKHKPKNVLDIRFKSHGAKRLPVASHVKQLEKVSGSVQWFDAELGYGFVIRDNTNENIFVHKSAIEMGRSLNPGDEVKFHVVIGRKGPMAVNVTQKLEHTEDLGRKHYLAKDISGRVKSFDEERGYGFIIRDDTNEEVFVHKSAIDMGGSLSVGDKVEFNVVTDQKGPKASYVTPSLGGGRGSIREFPLEEWLLDGGEGRKEESNAKVDQDQGRATPDPEQLCCGAAAKCVLVADSRAVKSVCGLCVQTREEAKEGAAKEEEALEEKFNLLLKGKNKLVTGKNKVKSRKDLKQESKTK